MHDATSPPSPEPLTRTFDQARLQHRTLDLVLDDGRSFLVTCWAPTGHDRWGLWPAPTGESGDPEVALEDRELARQTRKHALAFGQPWAVVVGDLKAAINRQTRALRPGWDATLARLSADELAVFDPYAPTACDLLEDRLDLLEDSVSGVEVDLLTAAKTLALDVGGVVWVVGGAPEVWEPRQDIATGDLRLDAGKLAYLVGLARQLAHEHGEVPAHEPSVEDQQRQRMWDLRAVALGHTLAGATMCPLPQAADWLGVDIDDLLRLLVLVGAQHPPGRNLPYDALWWLDDEDGTVSVHVDRLGRLATLLEQDTKSEVPVIDRLAVLVEAEPELTD